MKKLCLLIALFMLTALTVMACTQADEPADTTAATQAVTNAPVDATVADTQAPEVPTDATTDAPAEATQAVTDAVTNPPETPTDAPEMPTEPVTEAPIDPNAPIFIVDAEVIAEKANTPDDPFTANHIAFASVMTEDGYTFARVATTGGDPYITLLPLGSDMYLTNYMVISYRNNSLFPGQFYMGSGAGWSGAGDFFNANWTTDNEWDLMIVDISQTGMTSVVDDTYTYIRMDVFNGNAGEDCWMDIEFVAFFETPEQAVAYYEARHGELSDGYNDNSVVTPVPTPPQPETPGGGTEDDNTSDDDDTGVDYPVEGEPVVEIDFDLSQFSDQANYMPSFEGIGINDPLFNLVNASIYIGKIDLSKYSKCEIIYSTHDDGAAFGDDGPHYIGLKSVKEAYGFSTHVDMNGDIAHTTMVGEGGNGDLRVAVVDLSEVTYSGVVYVTAHNHGAYSVFISGIKLIP